jgi:hypothetical protein
MKLGKQALISLQKSENEQSYISKASNVKIQVKTGLKMLVGNSFQTRA